MRTPSSLLIQWVGRKQNRRTGDLEKRLQQAQETTRKLHQSRQGKTDRDFANELEKVTYQFELAEAIREERRLRLALIQHRADSAQRMDELTSRERRVGNLFHSEGSRWSRLWDQFTNSLAELKLSYEESIARIQPGARFRKLRIFGLKVMEYATLGVATLFLGVGMAVEGTVGTLGAAGHWLLVGISEAAIWVWSTLYRGIIWMVQTVLSVALLLAASIVNLVLAILMGLAWLISLPVIGVQNLIFKWRNRRADERSPVAAEPPLGAPVVAPAPA